MALIRRCKKCRQEGKSYGEQRNCPHEEAVWAIKLKIGSKQIFKTIGSNKREAERYLRKIKLELESGGSYQEIKPVLFEELAEKWLNNYKQSANPKPGTIWAYDSRLRLHILPLLGQKVVSQITAYDIEGVKQALRDKLSARHTNFVLVTIGTILKYGWTLGFCKSNPAQLVKKLTLGKGVGTTISPEEAVELLKHSEEPFRTIFFTMLCTGMRVGEVTALKWKDLDYKNNLIIIQRNVFRGPIGKYGMGDKTWIFGTPKSKESDRKVFMIPALKTALLRHSEQSQSNEFGLVFSTKTGNPYDRSMLRAKLNAATEAASLKHIRLHDCRHSNASWLLASGVNLAYVSKHLGHSSVVITGDTYHHVMPKEHERGMTFMDGIFPTCATPVLPQLPQVTDTKQK